MYFKEFAILTKLVVLVLHLEFYYLREKNFGKSIKTQTSHCLYISHGRVATPRFSLEKRKFSKTRLFKKNIFHFFFFKAYRKIHSTTETKITFSAI